MLALQTAVDVLTDNPELVVLLAAVLRLARAYQSQLTWPEYRAAHRFKRGVLPLLDLTPLGNVILLISDKGGRDDAEYVSTVEASVRETVRDLRKAGGSLHLICSLKRRPDTHGDPLSAAHLVWTHADGTQTEYFLFRNADGTTDMYAHGETSTDDPVGHLTDGQTDGDVKGVTAQG